MRALKKETFTLYLACRHPRVPWYAKALALLVVGYALSPIDLIPDFVPVLGYLDDLVLVPLGIMLVIRMIPEEVLAECRRQAEGIVGRGTRVGEDRRRGDRRDLDPDRGAHRLVGDPGGEEPVKESGGTCIPAVSVNGLLSRPQP